MRIVLLVAAASCLAVAGASGPDAANPRGSSATPAPASGPYLGQSPPQPGPEIFAPGIVSGDGVDILLVVAPGARELFFTRLVPGRGLSVMTTRQLDDTSWSEPEIAPFSGAWSDFAVSFSPDGHRLWMVSTRPRTEGGPPLDAQDIWYVERSADGTWSAPVRPGPEVNSDERDLTPCETASALYFSRVPAAGGRHEILRAAIVADTFGEPESITAQANLDFQSFEPAVPADERFMVFAGQGGPGDHGGFDLYVTFRLSPRRWSPPVNLGPAVNTPANEHFPTLSPDGDFLFFVSDRDTRGTRPGEPAHTDPDIYWVSTAVIERHRPG